MSLTITSSSSVWVTPDWLQRKVLVLVQEGQRAAEVKSVSVEKVFSIEYELKWWYVHLLDKEGKVLRTLVLDISSLVKSAADITAELTRRAPDFFKPKTDPVKESIAALTSIAEQLRCQLSDALGEVSELQHRITQLEQEYKG